MENNNSSHRPTEVKVGEHSGFVHRKIIRLIQYGGGSKGKVQGVHTAPPPRDNLRLSNTTVVYVRSSVSYAIL